jgi:hypothetical protein
VESLDAVSQSSSLIQGTTGQQYISTNILSSETIQLPDIEVRNNTYSEIENFISTQLI